MINQIREKKPLIHCITNYVTVNDVANMILAVGGSPIMADSVREVEDISRICNGLVINIGTLNERTIESMILAGKAANQLGHPVIFDPVGTGASRFRTETAKKILNEISCQVIRGNASEIKSLAKGIHTTNGVDACEADRVTSGNLSQMVSWVESFSKSVGAVIAMTGEIDLVSDGKRTAIIRNGNSWMSRITGTGCMLDGVIAAFAAANPSRIWDTVVDAVAAAGICGERACQKAVSEGRGTASFRMHLIDEMSLLSDYVIEKEKKIEVQ